MTELPKEPTTAAGETTKTERERIAELVDQRLSERWKALLRQFKMTAWVLGGLATVLGISECATRRGVTEAVHTYVLGFDQSFSQRLKQAYDGAVVLSYSNSFALDPTSERFVKVLFYSGRGQQVEALVRLSHVGKSPSPANVQIRLSGFDKPVWEGSRDFESSINLGPFLASSTARPVALPDHVHELTFSIEGVAKDDKVLGSVLVNVKGRAGKQNADTANQ